MSIDRRHVTLLADLVSLKNIFRLGWILNEPFLDDLPRRSPGYNETRPGKDERISSHVGLVRKDRRPFGRCPIRALDLLLILLTHHVSPYLEPASLKIPTNYKSTHSKFYSLMLPITAKETQSTESASASSWAFPWLWVRAWWSCSTSQRLTSPRNHEALCLTWKTFTFQVSLPDDPKMKI